MPGCAGQRSSLDEEGVNYSNDGQEEERRHFNDEDFKEAATAAADHIGSKTAQGGRRVSSRGGSSRQLGADKALGRQEVASRAVNRIAGKTAREERPNSLPGKEVARAKARVRARP